MKVYPNKLNVGPKPWIVQHLRPITHIVCISPIQWAKSTTKKCGGVSRQNLKPNNIHLILGDQNNKKIIIYNSL